MTRSRRGRPSKGPRELVWGRIPEEHHDAVEHLMAEHQVYKSDVVAALIAIGLQHVEEAGFLQIAEQEALPLRVAARAEETQGVA